MERSERTRICVSLCVSIVLACSQRLVHNWIHSTTYTHTHISKPNMLNGYSDSAPPSSWSHTTFFGTRQRVILSVSTLVFWAIVHTVLIVLHQKDNADSLVGLYALIGNIIQLGLEFLMAFAILAHESFPEFGWHWILLVPLIAIAAFGSIVFNFIATYFNAFDLNTLPILSTIFVFLFATLLSIFVLCRLEACYRQRMQRQRCTLPRQATRRVTFHSSVVV